MTLSMALVWNSRCVNLRPSEPPVPPSGTLQGQSTPSMAPQAGGLLAVPHCADWLYDHALPTHCCSPLVKWGRHSDTLRCSTS